MGVRLPAEYQEVEYLDSTYDGQYIDTLLTVGNNIKVEVVFQFLADYARDYTTAFGTQARSFCAQLGTSATKLAVQSWGANHVVTTEDLRNKTTVILEKTNVTINGSSISLSPGNTVPSTTLWLFGKAANASSSGVEVAGGTRIYSVNVYDGEVIRGSFIPCYRKSDDKPGMYDLISDTFFFNQGAGEFLVGGDVVNSVSPWLVARRRLLMYKKPVTDTSPKIVGYDKRYNSSGNIIDNNGSCCTDKYDIVANTPGLRTLYYFGIVPSTISWKNGTPFDHWNITATTEPGQGSIIAQNTDQVSFTLSSSLIDDSFAIQVETGNVLFAGINSPYYGKQNIND